MSILAPFHHLPERQQTHPDVMITDPSDSIALRKALDAYQPHTHLVDPVVEEARAAAIEVADNVVGLSFALGCIGVRPEITEEGIKPLTVSPDDTLPGLGNDPEYRARVRADDIKEINAVVTDPSKITIRSSYGPVVKAALKQVAKRRADSAAEEAKDLLRRYPWKKHFGPLSLAKLIISRF